MASGTSFEIEAQAEEPCIAKGGNGKIERQYKTAIILFSITNVFLLILIIITAVYAFGKPEPPRENVRLCLPCTDLEHHPYDTLQGIEVVDTNSTKCCVKKNEDANLLVGYFADTWIKKYLARENKPLRQYVCNDTSSAAKPVMKLVGKSESQEAKHHKLRWNGDHDLSISRGEISHHREHGYIEIKVAGLYQIYSQVVLKHDMHSQQTMHFHQHSMYHHCIILIPNGVTHNGVPMERTILKNSNPYCSSDSDMHHVTSFVGGAFQLLEGDRIAVKVSNKSEISLEPHMNFFGAHML